MKVLVTDPISEEGIKILKAEPDVQVDVETKLTKEQLIEKIKDYDALIIRSETQVTKDVIEAGKNLKIIGRAGVGIDNVDVPAATDKGIIVANAPEGNMIAACEHTIAMMFSMSRNIPQANISLKSGKWERSKFMGVEVLGKTLGVVGMGRIGGEVTKRVRGMGMEVLAYDPFTTPERAQAIGAKLTTLDEIYEKADFITVHTPLIPSTKHMISTPQFEKMKDGVRIINCARGGIIDEAALLEAIKSGKVAGAALDVFEKEPPVGNPLLELNQVIVTPHLGASTQEAQVNVAITIAEQVLNAFKGLPVTTALNIPIMKPEMLEKIKPFLPLAEDLGKFIAQITDGQIKEITVGYSGEIAQREVSLITIAALKGLLDVKMGELVNYVNAKSISKDRGINVVESKFGDVGDYTNLITVTVKTDMMERKVSGTIFGNKDARIVEIEGYRIDAIPEGYMIVTRHKDRPGVIGNVGTVLGQNNINIAGMVVGRETVRGEAIMILSVDDAVPQSVLNEMIEKAGLYDARYVYI
ncbi:phosphoglycerate dehydrogenase [Methanocella sp. CWC-04]|uniref:D-3-phosphoglycerate dehydrogenase n=1 Tax=Methanooceanicella nereidis TaxID=2052831 RepID=A0AAP2RC58_9EURY|nr:phosphoglycerate dehydrogenase [Methanocella sp. CWC-04]MCD1294367.1 phosphoglycerate dehydrogenase [Methanocella sp. CWC-04]